MLGKIDYLGHVQSKDGVQTSSKKLKAVANFPLPKTVKIIREFVGLASYDRCFIKGFADIAKPLTNLLKNDIEFKWTDEVQKAFEKLKQKL